MLWPGPVWQDFHWKQNSSIHTELIKFDVLEGQDSAYIVKFNIDVGM